MKWWSRPFGMSLAAAAIAMSGTAWGQARVVEPARPGLLEPARRGVTDSGRGAREEPGLTLLRRGRVRVYTAPVVIESPSIAEPRRHGAVLPGITIRFPALP